MYYSVIVNNVNEEGVSNTWVAAFIGFSSPLLELHPIQLPAKYNACVGVQSGTRIGLGISQSRFESECCHWLAMSPWESHLTSLSFRDVISKLRWHPSHGLGSRKHYHPSLHSFFLPLFLPLLLYLPHSLSFEFHDRWHSSLRHISFLFWSFPWIPLYIVML